MNNRSSILSIVAVLMAFCAVTVDAQSEIPTAFAPPLQGITIDGNLDDWPEGMIRYPILNHGQAYGPTDIDEADLTTSEDLTPEFMIGYSPEKNLIYIAVMVRDDIVHTGYGPNKTDGCEIYVEGIKEGEIYPYRGNSSNLAAFQYVMTPPGGSYDFYRPGIELKNNIMYLYDISETKTISAYSREGDISVFEWAIEAFEQFPDVPTELIPGRTIGLDVVVTDKDSETDNSAWVCWGPYKPPKFYNASSLGDIILIENPDELGTITGTVNDPWEKSTLPGFTFGVYHDDVLFRYIKTDSAGRYKTLLPQGKYSLIPKSTQGVLTKTVKKVTIEAGKVTTANLRPKPVKLPVVFEKAAEVYKNLDGYRDSTLVIVHLMSDEGETHETLPYSFSFQRPDMLRFESAVESSLDNISVYDNGENLVVYKKSDNRFMTVKSPESISMATMQMPLWQMAGNMIDLHFILSDNPLKTLLKNVAFIRESGSEKLNGESVAVIEIVKPYNRMVDQRILSTMQIPVFPTEDSPVGITLWIGKKDYLIKKLSFKLDVDAISESLLERYSSMMTGKAEITVMHSSIELNPDLDTAHFTFELPVGASNRWISSSRAVSAKPKEKKISGSPAPEFTLPDVDGNEVALSDIKGKVIVLNFWASWSEPCLEIMQLIQKMSEKYGEKDVAVIGINTLEGEDPDYVKSFLEEHDISYRVLLDSDDTIIEKYGLTKIPACFVIDKTGNVRFRHVGKPSGDNVLERNIVQLIKE